MTSPSDTAKPKTLREVVKASKAAAAKAERARRATDIFNILEKYHPEVTKYMLAAALRKKWDTVKNWTEGVKVPNATSLKRLEVYFDMITNKGAKRAPKTVKRIKRKASRA